MLPLRFSLIVPTVGRAAELDRLLHSLLEQGRSDFELILVDQNTDDRVERLLSALPGSLRVRHLREAVRNVSRARNVGMSAARGQLVAFPDDDCWYPADLLNQVDRWFQRNPRYSVLAVGALDEDGISSGNRWIQSACDINPNNALRTTFCSSLFVTADLLQAGHRFDERLSQGEETDLVLRYLARERLGRFDRSMHIHHPRRDMLSGTVSLDRARKYGSGMGLLVRRHCSLLLWIALLGYDLARALLVLLRGRFADARVCLAHAQGLFRGFLAAGA